MRTPFLVFCSALMIALSTHAGVINHSPFADRHGIFNGRAASFFGTAAVPAGVALGIVVGVFLVVILARSRPVRDGVQRWRAAIVQ